MLFKLHESCSNDLGNSNKGLVWIGPTISGFLGNSTIPLSTTVDVTESVQVRRRNGRPLWL